MTDTQAAAAEKARQQQAAADASEKRLKAITPAWAKALIVAELEQDDSDSMSDYYGSRTVKIVPLAWSTHTRDIFSELRKAAAKYAATAHLGPGRDKFTCYVALLDDVVSNGSAYYKDSSSHWHQELYGDSHDGVHFTARADAEAFIAAAPQPETIHFEDTPVRFGWKIREESIEHREKWSMGHGYYLAGEGRYAGWQVRKTDIRLNTWAPVDFSVLEAPAKPATTATTATPAAAAADGITITRNEEKNGIEIRFPSKPAASVLEELKANGWRWSRFSSCWWHRDTPEARAFAQSLHAAEDPHCTCNDCIPTDDDDPTPTPSGPGPKLTLVKGADGSKLRALADGMNDAIENKMNPGVSRQNLTARRARIADGMRVDGLRLQQVQTVLRRLADAHEDPARWPAIEAVCSSARELRSKAAIERLAVEGRTWIDGKNKYTPSVLEQLAGPIEDTPADVVRRLERGLIGTKIPGFFPTPAPLAEKLIDLANIEPGQSVLEPSAGKGDLAELAKAAGGVVTCVEINSTLRSILKARGLELLEFGDIFEVSGQYDRVVMNPPFEKGQDLRHVRHCFDHLLAPGGVLVSVIGNGITFREDHHTVECRDWMAAYLTHDEEISSGFKGAQAFRQTDVTTRIIVLEKPAAEEAETAEPTSAAGQASLFDLFLKGEVSQC